MDYGAMMAGAKKTIGQVAHDIAGSQFRKDVLPGKENLMKEVSERVAKNQDVISGLQNAKNFIINTMSAATGDPDYSGGIGAMLRSKENIDSVVSAQLQILKKRGINSTLLNDDTLKTVQQKAHEAYQQGVSLAQSSPQPGRVIFDSLNTVDKAGQIVQTYFSHPNEQVRTNRILGAVGAYGVASVGGRVMSGGNLTTDRYGRQNIAGIPFI